MSGMRPAVRQTYRESRPPLSYSTPAGENETDLAFWEEEEQIFGLPSYPMFPSAPLMIDPQRAAWKLEIQPCLVSVWQQMPVLRLVVEQSERREHHLRLATPWMRAGPRDVWLGPSPLLEIQHPDVVAPVGV